MLYTTIFLTQKLKSQIYQQIIVPTWLCPWFWRSRHVPRSPGIRKVLFLEMAIQIHELWLCVKNCTECIAYIISPFLTIWKIGIVICNVYMRKIMLAKLELDFKPKDYLFPCYFYDSVLSFTILCHLLCLHPASDFLVPDIGHLLPLMTCLIQSITEAI